MRNQRYYVKIALLGALCSLSACSNLFHSSTRSGVQVSDDSYADAQMVGNTQVAPGVVQYIWEEPMVDTIEVPPGLDPEGHYYRPAHQSVVEIRQGRWRYHKANQ